MDAGRVGPQGTWTSSRFRWTLADPHPEVEPSQARAELPGRWLAACGPATEADLGWWTGWNATDVRAVLTAARRPDGVIAHRFLADAGAEARRAVEAEAARLAAWIGDVRVTPRFRTPPEGELATGA
ncbi:DNA glycosylase AlkZ-like family protein [Streptomyces sp. NPDC048330]|uniref:DNA glycosylase AlkZ-like family protein n=1 Tax=Streptomyces sp. NPDC048330 TaxID=3365533 RepID=UPI00371D2282